MLLAAPCYPLCRAVLSVHSCQPCPSLPTDGDRLSVTSCCLFPACWLTAARTMRLWMLFGARSCFSKKVPQGRITSMGGQGSHVGCRGNLLGRNRKQRRKNGLQVAIGQQITGQKTDVIPARWRNSNKQSVFSRGSPVSPSSIEGSISVSIHERRGEWGLYQEPTVALTPPQSILLPSPAPIP